MEKEIYLDNSATTPLSDAALKKINEVCGIYGNPSSLHSLGQRAEKELKEARNSVLDALGVRRGEGRVVFTSCGSEATALAIIGSAHAKERREANRILITDSEHPSVRNTAMSLVREGFEVIEIPTKGGELNTEALTDALSKKIFLASFMLVNNETGAVYDVANAFRMIKASSPEAITHCDAVQGFMKLPFTPKTLCADLVSISGHKVHAPKGVGALYVSEEMIKKKKLVPFLYGGGQEGGLRSGTENTIGISAFGAAVSDIKSREAAVRERLRELYDHAEQRLTEIGIRINRPKVRADHIMNITVEGIKSETLLHFLSAKGVFVSSGSACSAHSGKTSSVLLAFGLDRNDADCSLRISFSEYNSAEDIDALALGLSEAMERLVRIKR